MSDRKVIVIEVELSEDGTAATGGSCTVMRGMSFRAMGVCIGIALRQSEKLVIDTMNQVMKYQPDQMAELQDGIKLGRTIQTENASTVFRGT